MTRFFKPGDRVMLKSGGPVMVVIKYIEGESLGGMVSSNTHLLCVWYDREIGRQSKVFHQKSLVKIRFGSTSAGPQFSRLRQLRRNI